MSVMGQLIIDIEEKISSGDSIAEIARALQISEIMVEEGLQTLNFKEGNDANSYK
jgi:hypothetical protein